MMAVLAGIALADPCPAVDVARWSEELHAAELAFGALDEPAFDQRMEAAAADLPCLDAPVTPSLAAAYHRLVGLRRYVRRDEAGANLAFAAAKATDPYGAIPSEVLPAGHELRKVAEQASTPGATVAVPKPKRGRTWFDGRATSDRPADRPTLVQVGTPGALTSRYLAPDEPMPAYDARPGPARWIAGGAGVALLLGGGALYGLALDQKSAFTGTQAPAVTKADLLAAQAQNHRLVGASAGALALGAAGIGVAAVLW